MSSKSRGTPASIRIRDNQRRSRAQRKEFVDSLQRRVQEYERRGIAATVEVQRAAQAVARENAALRRLLARHGITEEEIAREVQSANEGPISTRLDVALRPQFPQPECNRSTTPAPVSWDQAHNSYEAAGSTEELPTAREPVFALPTPPAAVSDASSAAETSCVTAAIIIAQMRGDGDDEYARTMLGCEGTTECRVKNTALFQVLDEV